MEAFSRAIDGGLDIAVESFFHARTVWHAEWEDAPSKVLAHHWPGVPNFRDVTQVDWSAVEPVDIITGGFPCQDVSMAGKRAGMTDGTRSNLWGAMRTAVEIIRPKYVVAENVRGLLSATADSDLESCPGCVGETEHREHTMRALGRVLGDLADLGYDAKWYGLRAADIGAPHGRFRVFILATDTKLLRGATGRPTTPGQETSRRTSSEPVGRRSVQAPTDTDGSRRDERKHQQPGISEVEGPDGAITERRPDARGSELRREGKGEITSHPEHDIQWGAYESAIRRWERVLGRPTPPPTELSAKGKPQLSPVFVEWMMGLNEGHVTGIEGISRANQLKMLGNGVVPQQAFEALRRMMEAA